MKKKIIRIVLIIIEIILLVAAIFVIKNIVFKMQYPDIAPFIKVKYSIPIDSYCSCLTFHKDNEFGEYDCDSEPTGMPFNGEFYEKYYYNKKKNIILFKGDGQPTIKAQVLKWTNEELQLKVIEGAYEQDVCASNGKDIYTYYVDEINAKGKVILEYLADKDVDNLKIMVRYNGDLYNNFEEKCVGCNPTTTEDIISKIIEDREYLVYFSRDKNGELTGLSLHEQQIYK